MRGGFSGPETLPHEEDYRYFLDNQRLSHLNHKAGLAGTPCVSSRCVSATLDTAAREQVRPHDPPGSDADAWFSALDDRTIELGRNRCVARVQGIHTGRDSLWIQLTCEG